MVSMIAGTRIEDAHDDDRERTLMVSDLHVTRHGGAVADAFARLCVRARAEAARTRMIVLGDLFEMFLTPKQLELRGGWSAVRAAICATVEAGVPVTVLHGNRDFLLDRRFERATGCRVVAGGLRFRLGATPVIGLHGDELCLNDVGYQRAKRWLRHPLTRLIARVLPLSVALRVGDKARQKSGKQVFEPSDERFAPVASAVGEVFESGARMLVFGHIHQPARGAWGEVGEYCVLPAFDESEIFLEAEGAAVRYRNAAGEVVPDFAPRRFPERGS